MTPASQLLVHAGLLTRLAAPYPFDVGETLRYEARLGYLSVGTASISVNRVVKERGTEAFELSGAGEGGPPGWRVRYDLTSWVSKDRFHSLRFHRRRVHGTNTQEDRFVILPDSARYRREGVQGDWVAPANPLDELAFLYYLRTLPLEIGRSYSLERYFQSGYNPVRVDVIERESLEVAGSATPALAVSVTSRGNKMRVWLTDDARRLPARMELPLMFGVVTLELAGKRGGGEAGK